MMITYLIGNGFDLAMGLETSFAHFNAYYQTVDDDRAAIKKLKEYIRSGSDTWSNAEYQFGQYSRSFTNSSVGEYLDCQKDYLDHLSEYLTGQNGRINVELHKDKIYRSFSRAIENVTDFLDSDTQSVISDCFRNHQQENCTFDFLVFNYTDLFERCLGVYRAGGAPASRHTRISPRHAFRTKTPYRVHGKLGKRMIFGVNGPAQIASRSLRMHPKVTNMLVKPMINEKINRKSSEKCKEIIKSSSIVFVYGMSMGETDADWWICLGKWLKANESRHIVIFTYDVGFFPGNAGQYSSLRIDSAKRFIKLARLTRPSASIRDRIHVMINEPLFGPALVSPGESDAD